jgi:hypothetical protein
MPLKIRPLLEKKFPQIQFLEFDPTENFPDDQKLIFIDTVINLKKPILFTDIFDFAPANVKHLSVHGFDFYAEIALRKKAGLCNQYYIIGVPSDSKVAIIAQQVTKIIKNNFKF